MHIFFYMTQKRYPKALIIDDNREILVALRIFLRNYFDEIHTLKDPERLTLQLAEHSYDLILLDMNFSAGNRSGSEGLSWLSEIIKTDPSALVICITAYGAVDLAVKAMQAGASDFIEKPWDEEKLLASIMRVLKLKNSQQRIEELEKKNSALQRSAPGQEGLVRGVSLKMQGIWESIEKIAPTDANVLILGENGTGKEVLAREIHRLSERSGEAFVHVDLGAISSGLFESELFGHVKGAFTDAKTDREGWIQTASGGTLFLDEVANLQPEQQAKLLSVLQNREVAPVGSTEKQAVDIRLISATNANLSGMVQAQQFREDLLYRMNTLVIEIPPLRERREDIPDLVRFYQQRFCHKYRKELQKVPDSAMKRLQNYEWPGNIRELKHSVERAIIMGENGKLEMKHFYFPGSASKPINESDSVRQYDLELHEKRLIERAINDTRGNYSKAAQLLGISRRTLYNKIEKYGIK